MKTKQGLAAGALLALPFAAIAQSLHQPDPLAANAPVPASAYVSAFKDYQAATGSRTSPDQEWRAANDAVAKLGGHAGHVTGSAQVPATAQQASIAEKPGVPSQLTPMQMEHKEHRHH